MTRQFLLFLAATVLLAMLMRGLNQLPQWLETYNRQAAPEDGALDLNED
jgi:hypothetical protein